MSDEYFGKKYFVALMEGYKPAMIGGAFFRKNKHLMNDPLFSPLVFF
jgi:hypothetical protein